VGYPSQKSILNTARQFAANVETTDWNPPLRKKIEAYSKGKVIDFSDVDIDIAVTTEFQLKVILATRQIPYGETVSYGELATQVGHPRAARAVGTVMACNRFPLIIPCHRVLAAGGKLGGYSSPSGTNLKLKLLELETTTISCD
jgi:methylated-DNA-[protein]-cysteine S-methyltransferase